MFVGSAGWGAACTFLICNLEFLLRACCEIVATWFGCGRSPIAPGTVGSAAALLFFPLAITSFAVGFVLFSALMVLGTFAVAQYLKCHPGISDPKEVVVDEVCGQLLVFVIIAALMQSGSICLRSTDGSLWFLSLTGFVTFRIFDIVKPWPICFVDKNIKGALGVMLDDAAAAMHAAVVTLAVMSVVVM
ncbi:phosphatidylglycerophosphatase A family protein [Anaplasma phagocytophilum]|uniref:phosphatidylglycerophosphatase A family protein n=1 Tax=Anaplasma phagocytophilum TaxID=948 RepID=UPI00035AA8DC|nr:phosphatidylglycerophosphatase A [Anaplasma phagocytophilum]AGR80210.1 phosphatidylglycerophosphatase [Anaplasma phagocytophilum str. JM]AGR81465.1 phosphatidylglycerophosphatase [Anaplasma phagocytophilum str. Dog2]KDB56076.1 phosphatidylglycerophosphatase [Anaplasma phagocytophilum str. MRK]AGR78963.1 phosphatidylglycerophosphatase [Anaplasma phagocytophilum str. HZ2]EOA61216.1 phosphatidylglycerophosphatase A [Anaplasma phagocytophilum str. HGE1]